MSQLKIREMPQDERPREKLLARGPDSLTNAELIAILLRTGRRGMNEGRFPPYLAGLIGA